MSKARYYVEDKFVGNPWRRLAWGDTKRAAFGTAREWAEASLYAVRIRYRGKVMAKWVEGRRVR